MTNKDAFLKLLFNYYLVDENGKGEHDDIVEQIEKDLEVLEILKKNMWFVPTDNFKIYCNDVIDLGNEEEFNKIKEWLER